ncbi:LysR family transcriptional regulator [Leptodesmis sichuanensis]|uniref:LysR family transcriptional regulator n=1 Tax=Leptodesmis sichuanensis TaxID=2906798 RepID=UPI001F2DB2DC|nr:LysR family transcriptional regulator [Leptodesmis sichuanensis]UIE36951.1 LysR family transcriptional regulator [Leptodesmis sichuanensis A121]
MDWQRLSTLELRQICYFLAVVEAENNFSRAADRLHIEQPPLSQRVRSLEKALQVRLFDRRYRPLQLTAAGKVFWAEAQLALRHLERGITEAKRANQGELGQLTIGISSAVSNSVLPDILRTFRQQYPDVELELRELTMEQQLQELRDRQLDVGFEHIPAPYNQDPQFQLLPLFQEELVVALPEAHPLTAQASISLAALAQESLLLPSLKAFPFYQEVLQQFQQAGLTPNVLQNAKATWLLTLLSLVAAGVGVAILPSSNVQNIQRTGVVYRAIADLTLTRQLSAIWRSDHVSPVLQAFLKILQTFKLPRDEKLD